MIHESPIKLFFFTSIIILILTTCIDSKNKPNQHKDYNQEFYTEFKSDSLHAAALESLDYYLKLTGATSIKNYEYESYQILYQDAWNQGYLLKFENNGINQKISKTCYKNQNIKSDCQEFEHILTFEQWSRFKTLIYEYDFWTMEKYRRKKNVLDGDITFIEGRRPDAEKYNKRAYNLVVRASTFYGKAESLSKDLEHYAGVINTNILINQ